MRIRTNFESDCYTELLKKCLTASIYDESAWKICDGFRTGRSGLWYRTRRAFFSWLTRSGYSLVQRRPMNAAKREMGEDWPLFGYSMAGQKRLDHLEQCVRQIVADDIPGDLLETGVWRGGACILMKAILNQLNDTQRTVWLADSFQGLPKPTDSRDQTSSSHDLSECDYLKVSVEEVKENFRRFGLLDERVKFLKGWFCDTLPTAPVDRLALLRLDGDLYVSTRDALVSMFPKMSPGGYVVVDDYQKWSGCREAIDEFRGQHGIRDSIEKIDDTAVFWRVTTLAANSTNTKTPVQAWAA